MSSKKRAVHFGAGCIGRGFLGQLYFEGGYEIVFADADAVLVSRLNARRAYPLQLVSAERVENITVGGVSAIDAADSRAVADALSSADLVGVSVGVAHFSSVAPALAAGVKDRTAPLDVLLCENQWHAAQAFRDLAKFPPSVGLVETVIGRMVPAPTETILREDPLLIVAEPYGELPVARAMLRAAPPALPGLILADDFDAYEARKLFLHNMSHAALAYLGFAQNLEYIWQCVAHPTVSQTCRDALAESSAALVAEYGFSPAELQNFSDDLLSRYANQALGDTVARVAADPLRKLRPNDRLVGAANLCLKHNIEPVALTKIIDAARNYAEIAPRPPSLGELRKEKA